MSYLCDLEGHVMVNSSLTEQHICLDQLHTFWREERHIVRDIKLAVNNILVIQSQIPNIPAQTYQGARQTTNHCSFFCGPRGGIAPHHGSMKVPPFECIEQYLPLATKISTPEGSTRPAGQQKAPPGGHWCPHLQSMNNQSQQALRPQGVYTNRNQMWPNISCVNSHPYTNNPSDAQLKDALLSILTELVQRVL